MNPSNLRQSLADELDRLADRLDNLEAEKPAHLQVAFAQAGRQATELLAAVLDANLLRTNHPGLPWLRFALAACAPHLRGAQAPSLPPGTMLEMELKGKVVRVPVGNITLGRKGDAPADTLARAWYHWVAPIGYSLAPSRYRFEPASWRFGRPENYDINDLKAEARIDGYLMADTARCVAGWIREGAEPERGKNEGEGPPAKKKRGRPQDTSQKADKRIHDAWKTGRYHSYEDLAREMRLSKHEVQTAIDRQRKRLNRSAGQKAPDKR